MKRLLLLPLLLLAAAPLRAADDGAPAQMTRSLFGLRVTAQRFDPVQPWKKGAPERRGGYALAVGPALLLTTEQLVRDASLVEVNPAGSARYYPARIVRADRDFNLALLDVSAPALPVTPLPLEPASIPFLGSKGALFQFEEGGNPQEGSAHILRASMEPPEENAPALLGLHFLADIPLNGPGLPILQNGLLAGLVASYDRETKVGLLYPGRVLKRFVEDAPLADYRGLAVAGLAWQPLVDPAKRRYLKAPEGDRGVEVVSTRDGAGAAAVFQPGDVILSWSGYSLDQQGYYADPALGRMLFPAVIVACRPGDAIPVSFSRDGIVTQASVRLTARDALRPLVPAHDRSRQPAYLIEGGFVMRDLTGDYLQAGGADWMLRANARLVHLFLTRGEDHAPNGERIPILAYVLPDSINVGYQDIRDAVIRTVNGEPVKNLKDIQRIRDRDGTVSRIGLLGLDLDLALDAAALPDANARIADHYRIPSLRVIPQ